MKRVKPFVILSLIVGALVLLAACGDGEPEVATATPTPGPLGTIAFSYGNESSGIYPIVAGPARIQAGVRNYKFIEGSANGDCEKQAQDVENFITLGVDAIVVLPICGIDPLRNVIEQALAANIVVVGYSTTVPGGQGAIVYENVVGAEALADFALKWLEEEYTGNRDDFTWALFTFDQCGRACTDRTDPIRAKIVEATGVEPLEAEVVAEEAGFDATETFLQLDPGLNMVIGINDAGALGAAQALSQQIDRSGRDPGEIFVAGMDGQIEAVELIAQGGGKHGIYRASAALILDELGMAVVDMPANILEGKVVRSNLQLPYEIISLSDSARAQQIVDTYKQFTN